MLIYNIHIGIRLKILEMIVFTKIWQPLNSEFTLVASVMIKLAVGGPKADYQDNGSSLELMIIGSSIGVGSGMLSERMLLD